MDVYGTYNELVTGANLNQQTSLGGRPHCVNYGEIYRIVRILVGIGFDRIDHVN